MLEFMNIVKIFLNAFSDFGSLIVDIMFIDVLGFPLIYFAFGSGLAVYLIAKITLELIT